MQMLLEPWPWWISGVLIGLTVPLLYFLAGHGFGISTSFQEFGALCSPGSRLSYFKDFDKRNGLWTVVLALGIVIGGFIATRFVFFPSDRVSADILPVGKWSDSAVHWRNIDWFWNSICRWLYIRACDYWHCQSELAQSRGHHLFLCRRLKRNLGFRKLFFLIETIELRK